MSGYGATSAVLVGSTTTAGVASLPNTSGSNEWLVITSLAIAAASFILLGFRLYARYIESQS